MPARTYVAGLFDVSGTEHATPGLVPAADWLRVRFLVAGGPLLPHPGDVSSHRMMLDLRRGALLSRGSRLKAPALGLHAHTLRLVSLSDRAIGLQLIQLDVESGTIDVTIEASFEGVDLGLIADRLDQDLGVCTAQSGKHLAMASEPSLQIDGRVQPPTRLGELTWSWNWQCRPGQIVCFQRFVAVVRSDIPNTDPGPEARDKLQGALHLGWGGVFAAHELAWDKALA